MLASVIKQGSWLFFAQSITRVIGFFYTIFLARSLGISEFGLLSVALAYFSIFSVITEFGINRFLIREISKDESRASELFFNTAILRLTVTSIIFAMTSLFLYFLDSDRIRTYLVLLSILSILPLSISQVIDSIFIAFKKAWVSAIGLLVLTVSTTSMGIFFVKFSFGAAGAVSALVLGQLTYFIFLAAALKIKKVNFHLKIRLPILKGVLLKSLPYGLLGILGLLHFRIDTIMLSYMRGSFETGIYGAAYKFLEGVIFIPAAFEIAIFPLASKLQTKNPRDLQNIYSKVLKISFLFSLPFLVGFLVVIPFLIRLLLPSYNQSLEAISILAFTIPLIFMLAPQGSVLLSSEKLLRPMIIISVFSLALNITGNLILITKYGFIGAAWMTVISYVISFIIYSLAIKMHFRSLA